MSLAVTLSLTAGGMMVIFRFQKLKNLPAYPYLQYSLILIYTFGYYGLWSVFLIDFFEVMPENLPLKRIITYMGTPFLVLGLIMQWFWISNVLRKPVPRREMLVAIFLILLLIIVEYNQNFLGIVTKATDVYNAFATTFIIIAMLVISFRRVEVLPIKSVAWIVLLLLLILLVHISFLFNFGFEHRYIPMLITGYFFFNTAIATVFVYTAKVEVIPDPE